MYLIASDVVCVFFVRFLAARGCFSRFRGGLTRKKHFASFLQVQ